MFVCLFFPLSYNNPRAAQLPRTSPDGSSTSRKPRPGALSTAMIPAEPGQRLSRTPGGFPAAPFQKGDDSRAGSCSRLRVCGKRLSSSRCAVLPMAARFPPGVLSEGRPRERATAAPGSHPAGPAASNSTRPRTSGRRAQPPVVVGAPCSCREGGADGERGRAANQAAPPQQLR